MDTFHVVEFTPTCIFPHKERIYDSVLIRENKVHRIIPSPKVFILKNSIDKEVFSGIWEATRICLIPKIDNPMSVKYYTDRFRSYQYYERSKIFLQQLLDFIKKPSIYNFCQHGFDTILLKLRKMVSRKLRTEMMWLHQF